MFTACGGPDTEISRHLQIFEIFTSYFLPVIIITVLDLKVGQNGNKWLGGRTGAVWWALKLKWFFFTPSGDSEYFQVILELPSIFRSSCAERGDSLVVRSVVLKLPSRSLVSTRKGVHVSYYGSWACDKSNFAAPDSSLKKFSSANVTISKSRTSNGEVTISSSSRYVAVFIPSWASSISLFFSYSRSKRRQYLRVLRRCLCITIFDLSMNLPSYLLRLYLSLSNEPVTEEWAETYERLEEVSQIMYFAQFALNALYLICIIYDTPKRKYTVSHDFDSKFFLQKKFTFSKSQLNK